MPILLFIIFSISLASCSSAPDKRVQTEKIIIVHDVKQTVTLPDDPTILRSGDFLNITVFGQDNLSNTYKINQNMAITLPLIGTISVENLNEFEIASLLIKTYKEKDLLNNPDIRVERTIK